MTSRKVHFILLPFENCGVLLMGDFNTPSTSGEYERLIGTFQARDLYIEHIANTNEKEEPTFDGSRNSLILEARMSHRIDFIFALDKFVCTSEPKDVITFMKLKAVSFSIGVQPRGEELSDHWPLITQVVPKDE